MDYIYSTRRIISNIKMNFLQFALPWRIGICLLATIGVGSLNYKAGTDLALTIFYLVPIALATWFISAWAGYLFSVVSGLTWAVVDFLIARNFRHPTMHLWNGIASVLLFLVFSGLLALLKRSLATERKLARVDHLTGIPNRRAFFEAAQREVLRSRRQFNPLTIAYIDINDFKGINDKFGHQQGDEVLMRVGETIRINLRATDSTGRLVLQPPFYSCVFP